MRTTTARIVGLFLAAFAATLVVSCSGDGGGGGPAPNLDGGDDGGGSTCTPGSVGCECATGQSCEQGECTSGMCVDCERGSLGCTCRSNGSCDGTLRCDGDVCEACETGTEDCPCDTDDNCEGELECMEGVCAPVDCQPGTEGCPCNSSDPRCAGTDICDDNDVCRACATDMPGCPCTAADTCTGGLVCDADACREAVSCADLIADDECGAKQKCTQAAGKDAVCVAETCVAGYRWVDGFGCMKCSTDDCSVAATCSGENSIEDECADANKECDDSSGEAVCGDCLPNTIENGDRCVPEIRCGTEACGADEYCDTDDDTCKTLPCPNGQALDSGGDCADCPSSFTCEQSGLTGRIWPFKTGDDSCICETAPGYYMPPGGGTDPEKCDADDDGWVRREADGTDIRNNATLRQNARCDIRLVDTVVLFDEYGLSLEVGSCTEGLIQSPTAGNCTARVNMRLLETQRNDVPGMPTAAARAPVYGTGGLGRLLEASELNSLTKYCVDLLGDFNHDGIEDIEETQETPTDLGTTTDDQRRLRSFSFFGELQRAYYQSSGSGAGKLVIAERSRCDAGSFSLAYDANADTYDAAKPETYWRTCSVNRDPIFDEATPKPGTDFAQWSCSNATGTCKTPGPAHPTLTGGLDPTMAVLRDHGLCELNGMTPADGVWRGMNHHSQFKCVQVTGTATEPQQLTPAAFAAGTGGWALNLCAAAGSREVTTDSKEQEPELECAVDDPTDGTPATVGFAARRYQAYGSMTANQGACTDTCIAGSQYCDASVNQCKWTLTSPIAAIPLTYQGGCVNETVEWGGLACSYPDYNRDDELDAFGRYSCYGDAPNCLWGDAGERSVLYLADDAVSSDPDFCNNTDGKMSPCACWR